MNIFGLELEPVSHDKVEVFLRFSVLVDLLSRSQSVASSLVIDFQFLVQLDHLFALNIRKLDVFSGLQDFKQIESLFRVVHHIDLLRRRLRAIQALQKLPHWNQSVLEPVHVSPDLG